MCAATLRVIMRGEYSIVVSMTRRIILSWLKEYFGSNRSL